MVTPKPLKFASIIPRLCFDVITFRDLYKKRVGYRDYISGYSCWDGKNSVRGQDDLLYPSTHTKFEEEKYAVIGQGHCIALFPNKHRRR